MLKRKNKLEAKVNNDYLGKKRKQTFWQINCRKRKKQRLVNKTTEKEKQNFYKYISRLKKVELAEEKKVQEAVQDETGRKKKNNQY